jgi:hypothetical protein
MPPAKRGVVNQKAPSGQTRRLDQNWTIRFGRIGALSE